MNQKKAKAIRREIYGDYSIRGTTYSVWERVKSLVGYDKFRRPIWFKPTIVADKRRQAYQIAKKIYRQHGVV